MSYIARGEMLIGEVKFIEMIKVSPLKETAFHVKLMLDNSNPLSPSRPKAGTI